MGCVEFLLDVSVGVCVDASAPESASRSGVTPHWAFDLFTGCSVRKWGPRRALRHTEKARAPSDLPQVGDRRFTPQ
ncbi:hypothetical protein CgunFtcFv8_025068 [Champsocephalus gunnari]|nr:hypothetical protein CgunFtcFv8_025068 [Champsocephalus gunnari]